MEAIIRRNDNFRVARDSARSGINLAFQGCKGMK